MKNSERIEMIREYHDRTKHRRDGYANSLGYMDWPNQPDPFRSFDGTDTIPLPHPDLRPEPTFDGLYAEQGSPSPITLDTIGHFFYHSLALSAWKRAGMGNAWSLRINPSSGALHPTEGYLICGPMTGLSSEPGVYHYQPYHHHLERRAALSSREWESLTGHMQEGSVLIGLSSIYWRESWKYGERAFRYCNHDVGHAIGCLAYAARLLGWSITRIPNVPDDSLGSLMGTAAQSGTEAEHADCLLLLTPTDGPSVDLPGPWPVESVTPLGTPNTLSGNHHPWPIIDDVSNATRQTDDDLAPIPTNLHTPDHDSTLADRKLSAEQIIRQRRSARDMDGKTAMDRDTFFEIMRRLMPTRFPSYALNAHPFTSLIVFVNRVNDLAPGLYALVRDPSHYDSLKAETSPRFDWRKPDGVPEDLEFYQLFAGDAKEIAKTISCNQDIAGDGAFAIAMLAQFDAALDAEGPSVYPRLFWETGLIGQILYLEAEAAAISGTGIGCFFDDLMHEILGITNHSWQSLYHFTVGKSLDDDRLETIEPYHHLGSRTVEAVHRHEGTKA